MKRRLEELEEVVKEKTSAEIQRETALIELEKVVKAMTRKVLHLDEEIKNIKENCNKTDVK